MSGDEQYTKNKRMKMLKRNKPRAPSNAERLCPIPIFLQLYLCLCEICKCLCCLHFVLWVRHNECLSLYIYVDSETLLVCPFAVKVTQYDLLWRICFLYWNWYKNWMKKTSQNKSAVLFVTCAFQQVNTTTAVNQSLTKHVVCEVCFDL